MDTTREVAVTVNGVEVRRRVEPRRSLVDFLREDLELTGSHVGCEHGACGACSYDDAGQRLTGSMLDYLVPMAAEMPEILVGHVETPTAYAEGGFKGVGEAGTAGAPGAVLNAVNDALAPLGARVTTQPITPEVVLRALRRI